MQTIESNVNNQIVPAPGMDSAESKISTAGVKNHYSSFRHEYYLRRFLGLSAGYFGVSKQDIQA